MALPSGTKAEFIRKARQIAAMHWSIMHETRALRREWDALGLGAEIVDADFSDGLTAAQFLGAVGTLATIANHLDGTDGANLALIKKA